ncbi:MAG: 50S ribosomal protein L11 methyltransferase [Oscillospiraceae bacterium]
MEWTDLCLTVQRPAAQIAQDIATAIAGGGLYIEDYADLEEQVQAMAHVDLIEQELLDKPRDIVSIHLYLSPDENPAEVVALLQSRLLAAGVEHTLSTAGVQQEDWENSWKQYYHPLEIGRRLAVAPSWEAYQSSRVILRLDPGMAFGTGTHETTFLCLEVLDSLVQGGERMLDIGTGSGILAVAALLLGAKSALGIDIDAMAVRTARENAERNGVTQRFTAEAGDLAEKTSGKYDIITANIVADAIIRLAPAIPGLLAPGGTFVASGIIREREAGVLAALRQQGLQNIAPLYKNGWVALTATL